MLVDYSHNGAYTSMMIANWYGLPFFDDCDYVSKQEFSHGHQTAVQKKIVLIDWMLYTELLDNCDFFDFSWANLVISVTTEQVPLGFVKLIEQGIDFFNNPNTIHLVNGIATIKKDRLDKFLTNKNILFPYNHFFCTVASANDENMYNDITMKYRPYLFEALLGAKKSPRSYIYYKLRDSNLLSVSLVNLTSSGVFNKNEFINSLEILDQWGCQIPDDYRSKALDMFDNDEDKSVHSSTYTNTRFTRITSGTPTKPARISELIPTGVYQNSWYSLITETNLGSGILFITEKTAKVLFGRRIFIFFGTSGHLQHLKTLGFKTFDGILDESYDNEPDHNKRFEMAWKQVEFLATQDPVEIYQLAKPILDHNYELAKDIKTLMTPAYNFIQNRINSL